MVTTQAGMESMAIEFYRRLFSEQDGTQPELITDWVQEKVTAEMNDRLLAHFSFEEVENALFMMHPNKSPGPDGFNAGFYIKHWQILKDAVCKAI